MAKIKQLRENNIPFYPVTIPDAIVFDNGDNLNEKVSNLENELDTIEQLIPEQANPQNQLADKEFVNSSIATNTAQFRGTFDTLNELNAVEADTNDYGFVVDTDASGNTLYNRYKYNGNSWVFEYTLNNSSFTAEQWEAINSGITIGLVDKLTELPTNSQLTETLNSKADKATTVTNVAYSNNKITKTINGVTSDVVSIDTIKQDLNLTKSDVGLSNVDNTSDADKPISTATQNALDGKVDKVNGKGLSTNDYTTDEKNKLHNIAEGAQVNVLEGVKVNGTELIIDNEKKVNVIVPTKTSDLTNDDNTVKDPNYVHTDNNFTDDYKNKVDNSQENVIEHIKVNGTEQQIVEKTVDITVPTNLSDLNDDANHRLVTDAEKTVWNAKYDKPSGGIPKADLSNSVQRSLDKADTALQEHQDISGKADKSSLATVATTGKYEDLIGGPDLTGYATEQWVTNQNYIKDVSDKADKSEMSVSTNGDKTTIQLKAGTSATVINSHQDISGKQDVIADLNTIRSGAAAGATAYQKPSGGIPKSDLATDVQTSLNKADTALQSHQDLSHITNLIPTQASSSNQLADKDFVNSSVSTATATFRGTSATGLNQTQFFNWANGLTKDLNDYVFWNTTDSNGNTVYKRYKYDGTNWVFEYDLNNSSFTSEQWSAINSGITNTHVAKLNGIAAGAEVNVQSDWNETNTSSDAYIKNKPANLVQDADYVHTDNNYTTTEKNKLSGIASNAQVNVLEGVQVNGTDLTIANKKVNVSVPTKTSQLTNDDNVVKDASYVHTDNNYTTTEKNKLSSIASGAQVNVLEGVQVNGTDLPITNKKVNVDLSGKVDKVSGKGLSTYDVVDYTTLINSVNDKSESQITLRKTGSSVNNTVTVGTTINEKIKIENSVTDVQINGVTQTKSGSVVNLDLSDKVNVTESVSHTDDEFVYRQTGGGLSIDANNARIDRIKGKTLVWNQMVKNGNFIDTGGWNCNNGTISVSNGILTATSNTSGNMQVYRTDYVLISGHKYLYKAIVKYSSTTKSFYFSSMTNSGFFQTTGNWQDASYIESVATVVSGYPRICLNNVTNDDSFQCSSFNIFDLTLMFGAGNEPATVEEFESLFPGYHDYNAGKLISNDAKEIETVGRNLFDKNIAVRGYRLNNSNQPITGATIAYSDYIRVIPGLEYYFKNIVTGNTWFQVLTYDVAKNYIGTLILADTTATSGVITIPLNVAYLRIHMLINNIDFVCINISDPAKNGTYEPYKKSKINLNLNSFKVKDSQGNIITISGGLKSAGSVYDEIIGNKYIKRVGSVDLGTLTWTKQNTANDGYRFYCQFNDDKSNNIICSKYNVTTAQYTYMYSNITGIAVNIGTKQLVVADMSYTDTASFKSAMSGVILYYELATTIEYELAEPIRTDYPVDKLGTERVISDTVPTPPFLADITYYEANIKDIEIEGITEYLKRSELNSWITSNKPSYSLSEINNADDVKVIENLTGTGILKRTGDNTWTLDNTSYATASALSGYLPLTGGTLTGALNIRDNSLNFVSSTAGSLIHRLANNSNHQPSWFDGTAWKTIAYADNLNDYVRKSGDVMTGQLYMNNSYFVFRTADSVNVGYLNARGTDNALIWYDTTKWNTIWHSGNSNLSTVDWNAAKLSTVNGLVSTYSSAEHSLVRLNPSGWYEICRGVISTGTRLSTALYGEDITFNVGASSATNAMKIMSGGQVGIGTSSPAYKLDVVGTFRATTIRLGAGTDQYLTWDATNTCWKLNGTFSTTNGINTASISNPGGISITSGGDALELESTGDAINFISSDSFNFSGGGDVYINQNVYASKFIKTGGTSSQFLKADGSVDSNTYLSTASLSGYLPLTGGTITGDLTVNNTLSVGGFDFVPMQGYLFFDDVMSITEINTSNIVGIDHNWYIGDKTAHQGVYDDSLYIYAESRLDLTSGSMNLLADVINLQTYNITTSSNQIQFGNFYIEYDTSTRVLTISNNQVDHDFVIDFANGTFDFA